MIELEQFIPYIGATASHPDLISLIDQSGLKSLQKNMRADGGRIYVTNKELGIDRLYFKRMGQLKPDYFERFIFNSVFFFSANDIGYARFSGSLPYGISLDDDRLEIIKKVSQPPSFVRYYDNDTIVAMDRWDFKKYSLAIDYWEDDLSIRSGQITFPWPQRSKLLSPDYEPSAYF